MVDQSSSVVPTVTRPVPNVSRHAPTVTHHVPTVTPAVPTVTHHVPTVPRPVPTVPRPVPTVPRPVPIPRTSILNAMSIPSTAELNVIARDVGQVYSMGRAAFGTVKELVTAFNDGRKI